MIIWLRKAVLCGWFGAPAAGALRGLAVSLAVRIWMLAALVGATHGAAATASPCVSRAFDGASYIVCTFDLREYALRLFWMDENGVPYGGFDHLPRRIGTAPMVFAMNAGMYDESLAPVGLYIESGKVLKRANTASGTGNFHLKPNGIFYVDGENASVLTTEPIPVAQAQGPVCHPVGSDARHRRPHPSEDSCEQHVAQNPQRRRLARPSHGGVRNLRYPCDVLEFCASFSRRTWHRQRPLSRRQHIQSLCAGACQVRYALSDGSDRCRV